MITEKKQHSRVLVTGANGFVGQRLVSVLLEQSYVVNCAQRSQPNKNDMRAGCEYFAVGDVTEKPDWATPLMGVDCVVHLAARVHVMQETVTDPLAAFRKANVTATLELATAAIRAKVRRFIYISTIKVNGEQTDGCAFTEKDAVNPTDPYARSKFEAEQGLMKLAKESDMEVVIIRPVLIYGPGVKGNVLRLLQLIEKGWPLPFKGIRNQRSLLALDNLVDLILACIHHPHAANQIFLASDGDDLSTEELVKLCAQNMHRRPRLFAIPGSMLKLLAACSSRVRKLQRRLYGSLQAENNKAKTLLGWAPPRTVAQGLAETVDWYQSGCR